jgi:hypothetical protein
MSFEHSVRGAAGGRPRAARRAVTTGPPCTTTMYRSCFWPRNNLLGPDWNPAMLARCVARLVAIGRQRGAACCFYEEKVQLLRFWFRSLLARDHLESAS